MRDSAYTTSIVDWNRSGLVDPLESIIVNSCDTDGCGVHDSTKTTPRNVTNTKNAGSNGVFTPITYVTPPPIIIGISGGGGVVGRAGVCRRGRVV